MSSSQRWTLLAVCLGTFVLLLDITIVNVALPDIQRDLERSGAASGINSTFRQVGIAGLGAVFQGRVETKLTDALVGAVLAFALVRTSDFVTPPGEARA